jgi:hypothetical protein
MVEGVIMNITSTEILKFLAAKDGRYLLFEKGAPHNTELKGDVISLREPDGSLVKAMDDLRNVFIMPAIPREMFDDFMKASLIKQDGQEDNQHRLIFRLTADGLQRGKAA